jgi:hypothetical protein
LSVDYVFSIHWNKSVDVLDQKQQQIADYPFLLSHINFNL